MKKYYNHWAAYFFYAIILFLAVLAGFVELYKPRGILLDNWRQDSVHFNIPYYRTLGKIGNLVISHEINYSAGDILVLPRISGNRFVFRIDSNEISVIGGRNLSGNIWIPFHWISLPEIYAGKKAVLEIEAKGVFDLGVWVTPYLLPERESSGLRIITSFIFQDMYWLMIGVAIAMSAILFNYAFVDSRLRVPYLLNAIGIFLGAVYLIEFVYRADSGNLSDYLLVRKIILSSGYLGSWFILAGMEYYFDKRIFKSLFVFPIVVAGEFNLVFAESMQRLKQVLFYSALTGYISWIMLFVISCMKKNRILVFSIGFLVAAFLQAILSFVLHATHIYLIHIGYIFAATGVAWTIIQEFRRVHNDYHTAYRKSVLDPLTGAFNRFIIEEIDVEPGDIVILADMNDFKEINDRFGHEEGDRVLIEWVRSVKENIRESDKVIRLGGDEFMILLRGTRPDVISQIAADFQDRLAGLPATFSWGIQAVETSLDSAIRSADSKMYTFKKNSGNL